LKYIFVFPPGTPHADSILERHVKAQAVELANRPYEEQLQRTTDTDEIQSLKAKMRDRRCG